MKKKTWHSKHFQRIFRTVYLTTFGLLLLALAITYFAFRQVTASYLNSVMSRFLETAYTTVDHQIRSSLNNTLNMCLSTNGTILLASKSVSAADYLQAVRGIDSFLSQDRMLHSVTFYNHTRNETVTVGQEISSSSLQDSYDRDFIKQILTPDAAPAQNNPRTIPDSPYTDSTSTVLTSYFHMGKDSYVIANLSVSDIFSMLQNDPSVYNKAPTNYMVCHDRKSLIYSSIYHPQLENARTELLQILMEHDWNNSFNASINGVGYHFHVLDAPAYNLQIVSIIRQSDISASLLTYLLPFVIIIVTIGLVALIVNLKISYRLYSPIARIKGTLPANEPGELASREPEDEVEYITARLSDVSYRLNALFSYKQKSLSLSQEMFLKDQMLYDKYSDQEFWEHCVQHELPYHEGDTFVLVYAQWYASDAASQTSPGDQALLCFALGNVVHELFEETWDVRDIPMEKDGIAFLLRLQPDSETTVSNAVLHRIQDTFRQYFDLLISFLISEPFTYPHLLATSMQQLQELSGYRFFYPDCCVLRREDICQDQLRTEICPTVNINDLEQAVRNGAADACQRLLEAYWAQLPHYTCDAAIASINVFASKFITMMKKIESTYPSLPATNYHQLYIRITGAHTLAQTQAAVNMQLTQIMETIQAHDPSAIRIDIADVQRYLQQYCQDFSISSKSVAEHFHVSVSYLNRVFRQKSGESLSGYIKNLRLERARQLLLSTSDPVEVIAKAVGFENTKYFYSLFKTAYGVSPTAYRAAQATLPDNRQEL